MWVSIKFSNIAENYRDIGEDPFFSHLIMMVLPYSVQGFDVIYKMIIFRKIGLLILFIFL